MGQISAYIYPAHSIFVSEYLAERPSTSRSTVVEYVTPHLSSSAVPNYHTPETSQCPVSVPVIKANDSIDLSSQFQRPQHKEELKTRITMREVAHDVRNRLKRSEMGRDH